MFSVSSLFSVLFCRAVGSTIEQRKKNPRTRPGVVDHTRTERTVFMAFFSDFSTFSGGADGRTISGVIDDTPYHGLQTTG